MCFVFVSVSQSSQAVASLEVVQEEVCEVCVRRVEVVEAHGPGAEDLQALAERSDALCQFCSDLRSNGICGTKTNLFVLKFLQPHVHGLQLPGEEAVSLPGH